jgi:hypothetical protein
MPEIPALDTTGLTKEVVLAARRTQADIDAILVQQRDILPPADAPVTATSLRFAYGELRGALHAAHRTGEELAHARRMLKEAEAQIWPGNNETERKVAKQDGTANQRFDEFMADLRDTDAKHDLALAQIVVDEQRALLRLMELTQARRETDYDLMAWGEKA